MLKVEAEKRLPRLGAAMLGIFLSLAVLSRQWDFLPVPLVVLMCALLLFLRGQAVFRIVSRISLLLIVLVVVGASFSGLLDAVREDYRTQPQKAAHFSLANQPARLYLGAGDGVLFSDPVRAAFRNERVPVLYSETWGDYWCFFYVYGHDVRMVRFVSGGNIARRLLRRGSGSDLETNLASAGSLSGARECRAGLVPSLFCPAGPWGWVPNVSGDCFWWEPSPSQSIT